MTASYTPTEGDIFVSSWGYDQTNVDAYQVRSVSPSGKTVKVQRIATEVVGNRVRPGPARGLLVRTQKVTTHRVKQWDSPTGHVVAIKITSFVDAYLWDGESTFHET